MNGTQPRRNKVTRLKTRRENRTHKRAHGDRGPTKAGLTGCQVSRWGVLPTSQTQDSLDGHCDSPGKVGAGRPQWRWPERGGTLDFVVD